MENRAIGNIVKTLNNTTRKGNNIEGHLRNIKDEICKICKNVTQTYDKIKNEFIGNNNIMFRKTIDVNNMITNDENTNKNLNMNMKLKQSQLLDQFLNDTKFNSEKINTLFISEDPKIRSYYEKIKNDITNGQNPFITRDTQLRTEFNNSDMRVMENVMAIKNELDKTLKDTISYVNNIKIELNNNDEKITHMIDEVKQEFDEHIKNIILDNNVDQNVNEEQLQEFNKKINDLNASYKQELDNFNKNILAEINNHINENNKVIDENIITAIGKLKNDFEINILQQKILELKTQFKGDIDQLNDNIKKEKQNVNNNINDIKNLREQVDNNIIEINGKFEASNLKYKQDILTINEIFTQRIIDIGEKVKTINCDTNEEISNIHIVIGLLNDQIKHIIETNNENINNLGKQVIDGITQVETQLKINTLETTEQLNKLMDENITLKQQLDELQNKFNNIDFSIVKYATSEPKLVDIKGCTIFNNDTFASIAVRDDKEVKIIDLNPK